MIRRVVFAIATAVGVMAQVPAMASAPMVKTQAPGYYRMMLGQFEVTALSDGTLALPVDQALHQPPAKTVQALAKSFLAAPLETSFNSYLINTGDKLVLVDTGAGALFGPTLGQLLANLKAAGYEPAQVDEIYITHMHPDHIGGLGAGNRVFPNAVVYADQRDARYWLSKTSMAQARADQQSYSTNAMAALGPYADAGKLHTFDGDTKLANGIRAVANYGHTPGHTTYVVESQGQKLVLIGDLLHVAAVQFDDPSVTIAFDTDSRAAPARRTAVLADAAKQGYLIGGAHLAFPGLGHVRASGKGYRYLPVNYAVPVQGAAK
jgi:glyoxylase-like metal-dependent hydrolase (beta-lactamase superfamily II)